MNKPKRKSQSAQTEIAEAREHLHFSVACCLSGNTEKCQIHIDSALDHLVKAKAYIAHGAVEVTKACLQSWYDWGHSVKGRVVADPELVRLTKVVLGATPPAQPVDSAPGAVELLKNGIIYVGGGEPKKALEMLREALRILQAHPFPAQSEIVECPDCGELAHYPRPCGLVTRRKGKE